VSRRALRLSDSSLERNPDRSGKRLATRVSDRD
jgi:hypothetical protein